MYLKDENKDAPLFFSEVIWFCMDKLSDCLNVKEFNSPNEISLLPGNTDHIFHCTDDFNFLEEKISFSSLLLVIYAHLCFHILKYFNRTLYE